MSDNCRIPLEDVRDARSVDRRPAPRPAPPCGDRGGRTRAAPATGAPSRDRRAAYRRRRPAPWERPTPNPAIGGDSRTRRGPRPDRPAAPFLTTPTRSAGRAYRPERPGRPCFTTPGGSAGARPARNGPRPEPRVVVSGAGARPARNGPRPEARVVVSGAGARPVRTGPRPEARVVVSGAAPAPSGPAPATIRAGESASAGTRPAPRRTRRAPAGAFAS